MKENHDRSVKIKEKDTKNVKLQIEIDSLHNIIKSLEINLKETEGKLLKSSNKNNNLELKIEELAKELVEVLPKI